MRGGSATILLSVLAGTGLCYAAGALAAGSLLAAQPPLIRSAAGAAIGLVLCASAGFAMLPMARREVARLRETLGPQRDGVSGSGTSAWWLTPVARLAASVAESWRRRHDELKVKLKEVEIRHRVAEAERDHAEGILHSLRDAVIVTDAFNEVTLANEPAARLLGFRLDDAMHKSVDQVVGDAPLRQMIKEVRSSGVPNKERHVEHRLTEPGASGDKPGPSQCFDVTLSAIAGPAPATPGAAASNSADPGIGGVVTILRDITREKEISQMKSDFVSQASHELRTPISAINAYTEMLLDSEAQDEAGRQEFYKIIKGEAERLSRMIDNMLNISRIEAGIVSVERTEVDFARAVNEVIETMQAPAKEKNITLTAKAGPLIYTAEADRDLVYQVIMNLVSNSIKYTPAGGRVTIAVENDDTTRSVLVTIADTGLGIPPDAIDKIFDKFYRIENYKRVAKGTGLGLNLVKHIVETVHGGRVGVTSQVGMGSKFWFTIPYEYRGNN
jgi:two-component system phosphate regulon sensor histidine kinase PhoR